jgi:hypothetical protein
MSLFDSLGQKQMSKAPSPQDQLNVLKQNPVSTIKQAGFNIPEGMTDPWQMIQYLISSGQVSNPRLQMAQRMASMIGKR